MAAFVSIIFSLPLSSSRISEKEVNGRKAVSNVRAKLLSTREVRLHTNQQYHRRLAAGSKRFSESIDSLLDVSSCIRVIISGYWVGPSVEDGWGFVCAYLDPST